MKKKMTLDAIANFVVSSLPDYIKENRDLLVADLVLGSSTLERISIQTGVKHTAPIHILDFSGNLQAMGCNPTAQDETLTFTDRNIEAVEMGFNIPICEDNLLGKWGEYAVRVTASDEDLAFAEYVVDALIAAAHNDLEKLIWQGDTNNSDLIDGFLTILAAEASVVPVTITASSTYMSAIAQIIAKIPTKVLGKSPKIFVSPEFFVQLSLELVAANLFHFAPDGNVESIIYPGTRIEVINTPGLTGTDKAVASPLDNMFYGTDVEDAERRFKVIYDEKCDNFRIKFRWNSGVQVAFPDRVVLADLSAM